VNATARAWRTLKDNLVVLALLVVVGAVVAGFVVAHTGTDDGDVLRAHLKEAYNAELGSVTINGVGQVTLLKDGFFQVCTLDVRDGPDQATLSLCLPQH
jgi:hypothetical protein